MPIADRNESLSRDPGESEHERRARKQRMRGRRLLQDAVAGRNEGDMVDRAGAAEYEREDLLGQVNETATSERIAAVLKRRRLKQMMTETQ